ncbi:hypothetical protein RJ639_040443 [Escallonia herrerae]|uniref:Uncharacterized protein n=1 Tax=Escallonia herrerae TaxID=1293975 RepID=A0AA88WDG2_9ASTE|nr:hypothetical protein RJ639_040443 [Escallonia herrerae]
MGDDVQMIDASSQPCFQPVDSTDCWIDCELFDIADKDGVGDGQECGDLDVVPFENNEGETCDGEQHGDFEECNEETIMGKCSMDKMRHLYEIYN